MDLLEIRQKIEEFAKVSPKEGFEIEYFETGKKMLELYEDALEAAEEPKEAEELNKIFSKIEKLM